MKLDYREEVSFQNIDIGKLRPAGSYSHLLSNRTGPVTDLLSNPTLLKDRLKTRSCPLCCNQDTEHLATKDSLKIVKCVRCDLVYVNPVFDDELYHSLYESESYQNVVKDLGEASHVYRRERFGTERADFISRNHNPCLPKKYLDIGCSTGFTLEAMTAIGWSATGIELNPSAVQFGLARGLDIVDVPVERFETNDKFSAISMFDVLEHLRDPSVVLKKAIDLLCDGGNMFIYVPNWNSATRELLGVERSHFIWPTHHLTYFTPKTLERFLVKHGLSVFHWETCGLDLVDTLYALERDGYADLDLLREKVDLFQFYINSSGHGKNLRMFAKKIK
jgi:SAM-dependent methyltransferase